MVNGLPALGAGLGYRRELDAQIRANRDRIDWLELISEHSISTTRDHFHTAVDLSRLFPVSPHGVDLSIGTEGSLDERYVERLIELVHATRAPWFSDHLCFTRAGGIDLGQLTPLYRTATVALEIAEKARRLQEQAGVPFLLENITYYFEIPGELSEAEFITKVLEESGCGLLLDLTNVYVNSVNHGFDPYAFLATLPLDRVVQVHLGGCVWRDGVLVGTCPCKRRALRRPDGKPSTDGLMIDTHGHAIAPAVWDLLDYVVQRASVRGVLLERDANFPDDFGEILSELDTARSIMAYRANDAALPDSLAPTG